MNLNQKKLFLFKQRELALAKYDLIKIWENYRLEQKQKGISKKVADREFLTTYNTGLLYSKIFNVLGNISDYVLNINLQILNMVRVMKLKLYLKILKNYGKMLGFQVKAIIYDCISDMSGKT
ncbi:MAG: hypothetical protein ACLU99_04165 [Alphaproteobacteria bacterium]